MVYQVYEKMAKEITKYDTTCDLSLTKDEKNRLTVWFHHYSKQYKNNVEFVWFDINDRTETEELPKIQAVFKVIRENCALYDIEGVL